MPAIGPALGTIIATKVAANIEAQSGSNPLTQKDPSYFLGMCMGIGNGICLGAPTIGFQTSDQGSGSAPPIPGVGTGLGIQVDADWYAETLYTKLRDSAIAEFGKTSHEAWPPSAKNSGKYLEAICKGIAEGVKTYFASAWILTSVHPLVYSGSGKVDKGGFFGVIPVAIEGALLANTAMLQGKFWPKMANAIATVHADAIMQHSTAEITITGVCVPSPPALICGIPMSGVPGTGFAT